MCVMTIASFATENNCFENNCFAFLTITLEQNCVKELITDDRFSNEVTFMIS